MPKDVKISRDMDKQLKELGCLAEQEAVPARLRELAARLRQALLATRATPRHPPEQ